MGSSPRIVRAIVGMNLALCLFNIIWGTSISGTLSPVDYAIDSPLGLNLNRASTFSHHNANLHSVKECTKEQRQNITYTLYLDEGGNSIGGSTKCPEPTWIESFYEEEADDIIQLDNSFLGISVGCNKGHDAIRMARMGTANPDFDGYAWRDAIGSHDDVTDGACSQEDRKQTTIIASNTIKKGRAGEIHCIEPMPKTFALLKEASRKLNLDNDNAGKNDIMNNLVLSQSAISSRDGVVKFPDTVAGEEKLGIDSCNKTSSSAGCVDVAMYSLDSYVDKFVKSRGPINILQIDVEGWDFDVLFGASSVLDRTQYLEFEYHEEGNWGSLHLQDAVKLLNGKGFTCYWAGRSRLWRITGCYFEVYDSWHGWSNVACVHRTYQNLATRMEIMFHTTIANAKPPSEPELGQWCGSCSAGFCDQRADFIVRNEGYTLEDARARIMKSGHCYE